MLPGKLFDRMQFCFKQPLHSKKHFDTSLYLFESWITITPHKDGTLSWSSCAHFEGLFEINYCCVCWRFLTFLFRMMARHAALRNLALFSRNLCYSLVGWSPKQKHWLGCGGVITFGSASIHSKCSCTSTRTPCYAAACSLALPHIRHTTLLDVLFSLPHIHNATLLDVLLHFHTSCYPAGCSLPLPHMSCYAAGCSLALPHLRHATLLRVLLHSTHTSCYAAGCALAFPHIRHATLLDVLLHFHTYVMRRCWVFSCTSTHTSCYAAGCSLALPHIRHATLLNVLLHFHTYVMLCCWMFSCASTRTSYV